MTVREQIFEAVKNRKRLVPVVVPEWGITIHVARLTWPERIAFRDRHGDFNTIPESDEQARVRWMVRYVIDVALDETGKKVFSPEDENSLFLDSDSTAIERVAMAGLKLNSVNKDELADLGKGSRQTKNGPSPSGSPGTSD